MHIQLNLLQWSLHHTLDCSFTAYIPYFVQISYICRAPRATQYLAKRRSHTKLPDTCAIILATIVLPSILHTCFCAISLVVPGNVAQASGHRPFVDGGWRGTQRSCDMRSPNSKVLGTASPAIRNCSRVLIHRMNIVQAIPMNTK